MSTAPVSLLDWQGNPVRTIQDATWKLEDRADSTNRLYITTSLAGADGVKSEQELIFKGRRFGVYNVDRDRQADRAVIIADEVQAALADIVKVNFRPINRSLAGAMNDILSGTRWTIGEATGARDGNANFDEITALDALQFLARHQDAQLGFDSLRRRVNITPNKGKEYEYVFTYGRQLSNIQKSEVAPQTTVIYPTMGSGDDEAALDPVEDYGYYFAQGLSLAEARARFRKEDHWAERDYEFAENMIRDAEKRLAEEAYPQITYTLTAQATTAVDGEDDFDLAELHLGDQVYVWDQEIDVKLKAEVSAVTTSSDQSENVLILSALPPSLGASVEGRYFGDSGRPSDAGRRRSGPQPRPSMPILEQMGDYGIAVTRWNGQDHEGNYHTIPQRFGTLLTLVAPLEDGVIPSPMDSSHTFMGSDINKRGGGTSTIGFNGYGEFAVWHQMRGWDGETLSELSEPLVVDVPPVFDPKPLKADLEDARTRLSAAEARAQEAFDEVGQLREEWQTDFPVLQQELDDAKDAVAAAETRLAAAEQSVADSAAGLSEVTRRVGYLNEERLPALDSRLDTIEPVIEDYDDRIISAQDGADSARATAENLRDNTLPALDQRLGDSEIALSEAESTLSDTRLGMENLRDVRLPELQEALDTGLSDVETTLRQEITTASGSRIRRGTAVNPPSAPTAGVSWRDGDRYEQWTTLAAGGKLTATWRREGGQWRKDELDPTYIPVLDIGQGTAGDLSVDRIRGLTAQFRTLFIGDHSNIVADPNWDTLGRADSWWAHSGAVSSDFSPTAGARIARISGSDGSFVTPPIPAVPGETFRVSFRAFVDSDMLGSADLRWWVIRRNAASGAYIAHFGVNRFAHGWRDYSQTFTVPSNMQVPETWEVQVRAQGVTGGNLWVAPMQIRRAYSGSLIVDGSISARHIIAEEIAAAVGQFLHITAEQIDTEGLAAYLATIIQLDAGQITSGKINTARLDAQEVAAEVANFLTLDALEINVEQLAGQIANVIEVTAESIQSGAIQARHMTVANTDNAVIPEWLRPEGHGFYVYNQGSVNAGSSIGMERFNVDGSATAGTTWYHTAISGKRGWRTNGNQGTGSLAFRTGPGRGIPVTPGEEYVLQAWVRDTANNSALEIHVNFYSGDGTQASTNSSQRIEIDVQGLLHAHDDPDGGQWSFTVPDLGFEDMQMVPSFRHWAGSGSNARSILEPKIRKRVGGELIVDGGIKARNLDAEEIFFDQAVGNTVAAGIAEFLELHAEQITSGQIDADLLNVNDLAARVATVITLNADRITTGELGAERINVASFFTEDAFMENLRAAVVTALEVTAERGFIGGALLEDDSITVAKLTATDEIAAEVGQFLELNADQIRSNSWTGITATGATFQTHAAADRGTKMLPGGLRAWDNDGNLRFDLSSSTGNVLATGRFQTAQSGNRVVMEDTPQGGRIRFWSGPNRGAITSRATVGRLSMIYNDLDGDDSDLPFVGVEANRSLMGYRSQQISVGGTGPGDQYTQHDGGGSSFRFNDGIVIRRGNRVHLTADDSSSLAFIGQRPAAGGHHFEVALTGAPTFRVSNGQIRCLPVYDDSTTLSANMRVSPGDGMFRRSSSASKYKVDPRPLQAPDSLLDIPLNEWIDKGELERWGEVEGHSRPFTEDDQETYDSINLKRVPGVIAEQVEAHGGKQFVEYGPDGQLEEVDYDRLALAQIQVLKRKHDALEQRVRELEGAA